MAFDRLRVATDEEVDTVLGLDDLLPDDQLLALILANLGQETLDSQLGAAGNCLLGLGDLEALLLKRDGSIQSSPAVCRAPSARNNSRQSLRPDGSRRSSDRQWCRGSETLPRPWHCATASRCPSARRHWRLPGNLAADWESCRHWEYVIWLIVGSLRRVVAVFIQRRAGPQSDEGKVRPAPPHNLVVGDRDVLEPGSSDCWLPTSAWSIKLVSFGSLKNSVVPI